MNTNFKYLQKLFFLLVMGFSLCAVQACSDDEEDEAIDDPSKNTTDIAVTGAVDEYGCTYATISGYANLNLLPAGSGNPEIGVEVCAEDSEKGYFDSETAGSLSGNVFSVQITGLHPSTKYKYRSFVKYGGLMHYGEYRTFTTKDFSNVTSTGEVLDLNSTFATITSNAKIGTIDLKDSLYVGVAYSTSKSALHPDSLSLCGKKTVSIKNVRNGIYTVTIGDLLPETTYYYASLTEAGGKYSLSVIINRFETKPIETVDLGLSVKWAVHNIGASKPEEYGGYYAWGEIETKNDYCWSTYKWSNGTLNTMTKYCTDEEYGTVDNRTVLTSSDDVATVKWGKKWRMPTEEEMRELFDECTRTWTTQNNVNGYVLIGPSGKSIFLPAAGYRYGTGLRNCGSLGHYWSATLNEFSSFNACSLNFNSGGRLWSSLERSGGFTVRPVTE